MPAALLQPPYALHPSFRFMESPVSLFRMHWDHEPPTGETAPPRCCRHFAGSALLRFVCQQDAGSTLGFMESPHWLFRLHGNHESVRPRRRPRHRCQAAQSRTRTRTTTRRIAYGSWKGLFRFFARTMNRGPSRAGQKAPINRTHSRRFARFADARRSRSVWSACVFSAAFPRQAAIRWLGRFMARAALRSEN